MADSGLSDWRELHGEHFRQTRALVTGGAGFIGSHLCRALVELGTSVIVIDNLRGGDRENLSGVGVELMEASILDAGALARSMAGAQFVFHLAALGSVPASVERPREFQDVNSNGTLNVLEAAREAKVARVMFSASSSAYGENPVPWVETMPPLPRSPYAATKLAGEGLLRAYSASYGVDTVSLRYFNIFGPRQNANSAYAAVIAAFAKAILSDKKPIIYGDGEQSRDFTYVDNAVHANLLAARHRSRLEGEVINVGCGGRVTVNELAKLVASTLGKPHLTPTHLPERAGDIRHSFADLARAAATLNYCPIVDLTRGLESTLEWYRQTVV
ncbi:MAG TPA: NAD-dependent epimerase/dehydratase family protein [Humisphaera sp.]|jgi:UDP-glucose 4-epimerase|nr:NAD-dependent epimerase/dehydratase family protein [Humisphaera sp.]